MNKQNDLDDLLNDDLLFDEPQKFGFSTLIAIFVAIVALSGASWYIYDSYKEKNDNEMLLITAEAEDIKVQPLDPGGMVVDNMDKSVYDSIGKESKHTETKVEVLLQPTEEPIDKKELIAREEAVVPVATEKPEVDNESTKQQKDELKAAVISKNQKEPEWTEEEEYIKPVAVKTPKKPKFANKDKKFYKVQLASFKSSKDAEKEWKNLSRKYSSILKEYKHYIVSKDIAGRGLFYRLQVGPFDNADDANNTCKELKEAGTNCLIVKP